MANLQFALLHARVLSTLVNHRPSLPRMNHLPDHNCSKSSNDSDHASCLYLACVFFSIHARYWAWRCGSVPVFHMAGLDLSAPLYLRKIFLVFIVISFRVFMLKQTGDDWPWMQLLYGASSRGVLHPRA